MIKEELPEWLEQLLEHDELTPAMYNTAAPEEHRRRWGQYWTPPAIARFMAGWVLGAAPRSIVDPAAGTGALLSAVLEHPSLPPDAILAGWDADAAVAAVLRRTLAPPGRVDVIVGDFLKAGSRQWDAVVCNPPYLRHRRLHQRRDEIPAYARHYDVPLSQFTNSYALFMLAIAERLSPRGRAAILAPIDWLNANFGVPIKQYLLRHNLLDALVLFDHARLVFADANIAAGLLLLRAGRAAAEPIAVAHVADENALSPAGELPASSIVRYAPARLRAEDKWLALAASAAPRSRAGVYRSVPLSSLAEVRRGIATGANDFFCLSEADRLRHGLEPGELRLCLVKASDAPGRRFAVHDVEQLRSSARPLWLLDVGAEPSPAALRYLELGRERAVHRRYLTQRRRPWYAPEPRPAAALLVTTFSRGGFRCVVNDAAIAHLTAFHGVYPRELDRARLLALASFFGTPAGRAALLGQRRVYGSGLGKLEPLDLAALPVPDVRALPDQVCHRIAALFGELCNGAEDVTVEIERLWAEVTG